MVAIESPSTQEPPNVCTTHPACPITESVLNVPRLDVPPAATRNASNSTRACSKPPDFG
ncbi:hypothetical protein D3C83_250300 [compost metagenome]